MAHTLATQRLQALGVGPIDLTVRGGQCLAVTGPSGSGKSLLLRMIADLIPHQGHCRLNGVNADAMPAPRWRQLVRYASSEPGWWAPSVAEHFANLQGFLFRSMDLGLSADLATAAPERLSTGERQRVALLRAIEQRPQVLLLDEPTSALDHSATLAVESLIREMMTDGIAVILVSHDEEQVHRLADVSLALGAAR